MKKSIAIVDDHRLFAQSLEKLILSFDKWDVIFHATNGRIFLDKYETLNQPPDVVLMDINMPVMDGIDTMGHLKKNFPEQKVLALSVDDSEETIIKMLRQGARGYLLKDIHPDEFEKAISDVLEKGFYYSDMITDSLLDSLDKKPQNEIELKERELEFLKWACTEHTYKEIAEKMFLSPKTIDGYRETLFHKLDVRSRIGLVLYAMKHHIIEV
ncbi:response regulator transcription factor [Robertkochia aurantiaca]|uniref:response regulator transcription factor n=1 Tax=Robertkochia aurantiaca TaxID=2873700 RepID=UPI001CCBE7F7|nr:response regulator transcription factor [Robertkochia sp. 3YJGBD-33]